MSQKHVLRKRAGVMLAWAVLSSTERTKLLIENVVTKSGFLVKKFFREFKVSCVAICH